MTLRQNGSARPGDEVDPFFLFHRPRRWNPQEQALDGYERKRGKLADLNALLRGGGRAFSLIVGNTPLLSEIKYVITLDTDTQLPRESARQFVGAMAHPLNRPGSIPCVRKETWIVSPGLRNSAAACRR